MNSSVSIIVPSFNQAQYLPDALSSVLKQTYSNWECIIVDDGSPDNTEEVANTWCKRDKRFKYLKKNNGGLSSARNAGIQMASGDLILPLDADDYIHETYLHKAVSVFDSNPNTNLVYCLAYKFGYENRHWELPEYKFENLLLRNCIFCTSFFPKEAWIKAGGYDESLKRGWEDWAFWVKILNMESIIHRIPEILFFYRTKDSSMITQLQETNFEEIRWKIFEDNIEKYKSTFFSPIKAYMEIEESEDKQKQILNSKSFRIGNSVVRALNSFLK